MGEKCVFLTGSFDSFNRHNAYFYDYSQEGKGYMMDKKINQYIAVFMLCMIMVGCYKTTFENDQNSSNVTRFIEVYADYAEEPVFRGETYSFGYSDNLQLLDVSYLYQNDQYAKWEHLKVIKDDYGNPEKLEGEISGDNSFTEYILSVFTQDYMHTLENNDEPLTVDISRMKLREDSPEALHCEYAWQTHTEEIAEIRLDTWYNPKTMEPFYQKTIYRFGSDGSIIHEKYIWNGSQWIFDRKE